MIINPQYLISNEIITFPVTININKHLQQNGIDIEISHILTLGDNIGKINVSKEKYKVLIALSKKYDEVFFFDDDPKNIQLAKLVPGIKTRLIENNSIQ